MGSLQASKQRRFSSRVTLAVIGLSITSLKVLDPVMKKVVLLQKSIHHTPSQKPTDAFVAIRATVDATATPGCSGLSLCTCDVRV